jgi:hypothetical protein
LPARLGALFNPLGSDTAVTYRDVGANEFMTSVNQDHGIELNGLVGEAG